VPIYHKLLFYLSYTIILLASLAIILFYLYQSIYKCTLIFMIRILFYQVEELENAPVTLKFAEEGLSDAATVVDEDSFDDEDLRAASTFAKRAGCLLVFGMLILWPLPLFFSDYVFSLVFFRGWVSSLLFMMFQYFNIFIYYIFFIFSNYLSYLNSDLFYF
jgi:hypothetical protein